MSATVLRADARCLPLPDESVDLIVTSPPYFGLRSYTDGGEHYGGQIGSEGTPREWLAALLDCTREWVRVLKPGGSIFVNLGDSYARQGQDKPQSFVPGDVRKAPRQRLASNNAAPLKSLNGLPWRYALGCVDQTAPYYRAEFLDGLLADVLDGTIPHDTARQRLAEFDASPKSKGLGLILRAEIIWAKPNGLPESVTDRVRRSHEQLFHFTRQPRYFSAVDEVRESYSDRVEGRQQYAGRDVPLSKDRGDRHDGNPARGILGFGHRGMSPLGKLPGSVWEIPSQPLTVPAHLGIDHFAAFPMELPRRVILGWSPPGICTACGEGRRPVTHIDHERGWVRATAGGRHRSGDGNPGERVGQVVNNRQLATITGYACACPDATAPTRPAIVVDPFAGTGTTMLVASALGRIGIGVDRSADYCRLARWRTTDPAERARALGVPKPPPVLDGQEALFGEAL